MSFRFHLLSSLMSSGLVMTTAPSGRYRACVSSSGYKTVCLVRQRLWLLRQHRAQLRYLAGHTGLSSTSSNVNNALSTI